MALIRAKNLFHAINMPQKKPSALKRILSAFKQRKKTASFLFALVIVAQAANIVVPFIYKVLIDALTAHFTKGGAVPVAVLIYSALGILAATVLSSAFLSSYNYHLFKTVTKIEDEFRSKSFEKYLQLHALFHHGASSGQIIGRIERGGTAIYAILNDIIGQNLLPPLVVFVGTFIALLYQNVWIALAVLAPFPIYFLLTKNLSNRIYEIEQRANDAFEEVAKEAYDIAGNVLTVKKFSQEFTEKESHKNLMASAREIQYGAERLWGIIENIQTIVATVGRVAVLVLSGWLVITARASIGQFVLFVTLQNMVYQPLAQLSNIFPRLRRNITRFERMITILDEPLNVTDSLAAVALPKFREKIEFQNVSFAYGSDSQWALRNINLLIAAGSTVALIGRSGSGKTTFINLLLRSYDPQEGRILVDGMDIRDVTKESLRAQIAVVPQEVDLFSRSVADNIAYGRSDETLNQIQAAAKTALAHDFIEKLDNGYQTVVGDRGIKLSGGERQRIGIARAVLRDPRILILDEATSQLDTESERLITKATNALIKNRTSVIIAHRLSTILHADTIVVFKDNKIEATGKHDELIKISPTYKKLYSLQFEEHDHADPEFPEK
jgi:ABC-type multidrug transport system fused ATPase/permease subunit